MPHIRLSMELADPVLFDATMESYKDAVDRGEMTNAEAAGNLFALAEGMLKLEMTPEK